MKSQRQLDHEAEMARLRPIVFARDRWMCQAPGRVHILGDTPLRGFADRCWTRDLAPHHIWRRGQGGPDHEHNLTTLCAPHHTWVHAHVDLARLVGLLRDPVHGHDLDHIDQMEHRPELGIWAVCECGWISDGTYVEAEAARLHIAHQLAPVSLS